MKRKTNEKRPLTQCLMKSHVTFIEHTKNGFVLWANVGGLSNKDNPDYRWIIDASTIHKDGKFFVSDNLFAKEIPSWLGNAKQYKIIKEKKHN